MRPETRDARRVCESCGKSCGSPSSEAMSVMREEMTLGAPCVPVGISRGVGNELLGVEERGGLVGVVIAARQAGLLRSGGWVGWSAVREVESVGTNAWPGQDARRTRMPGRVSPTGGWLADLEAGGSCGERVWVRGRSVKAAWQAWS